VFVIGYDRDSWKADYFSKMSEEEKRAIKEYDDSLPSELRSAKNRKERIIEKLNALPDGVREKALQEFELHEYTARNERKHTSMIRDIPHPEMAVDENGEWIL